MTSDICPWLGTELDREIRHGEPHEAHDCYAQEPSANIDEDYQASYCLAAEHRSCPHYRVPPAPLTPVRLVPQDEEEALGPVPRRFPLGRVLLWFIAIAAGAAVIYYYAPTLLQPLPSSTPTAALEAGLSPNSNHTPSPTPSLIPPAPAIDFLEPTATPTPFPGGSVHSLTPGSQAVGWVASDEPRGNHLGDSYLYTGVYDGVIYHGVVQFDLSVVPRGAKIHSATLDLSGLDGRRLSENGVWEVRILARDVDEQWASLTFQDVHNAQVRWTVPPALGQGDLRAGQINALHLSSEQTRDLEQRLLEEHYTLSIRLDGPLAGENNVFAWDSGYGAATQGDIPRLLLNVGAAPQTPIPSGTPPFVVVTSTPTPANVLTAAASARTATAVATTTGQPTPTSVYEWTATPTLIVTNTPTPASQATRDYYDDVATAVALTTGTFTPVPDHMMTATATPLLIPVGHLTSTPTPLPPPPTLPIPQDLVGRILFQSDRAGTVGPWAMNANGRDVSLLTSWLPYEVAAGLDTLSPDGAMAVYAGTREGQPALFVRSRWRTEGQPILVLEQGRITSPAWSPRWDPIAFVYADAGGKQVWLVNRDGSELRQLTTDELSRATDPTFSPSGDRLAYTRTDMDGHRQVWLIELGGAGAVRISSIRYDEWGPVWIK